jgi:glucose-6-phosphate 1-epimerase
MNTSNPSHSHQNVLHNTSPEGLELLTLHGDFGSAKFAIQGAHLCEFIPKNQTAMLFVSKKSHFAPGKAIRGGLPIIFPWFGPRKDHPESPMHGLVRTKPWTLELAEVPEGAPAKVIFSISSDAETLAIWPHAFHSKLEFILGDRLEIRWTIRNTGTEAFNFEQALHPYFPVQNISTAKVSGLCGASYIDKTDGMSQKNDSEPFVSFVAETDRLYLNTDTTCVLEDAAARRKLIFEKEGSKSSVVWNPWIAKAAALSDMEDAEWQEFVCVEQVNAADNAILLAPSASHILTARYFYQTL